MELSIPLKLLLSLLLGAAIGFEREAYERKVDKTTQSGIGSLGVRSFALITTLGAAAALSAGYHIALFLLISAVFGILLIAYYIIGSLFTRDNGITTELAILWSYFIGIAVGLNLMATEIIIAATVFLILILSMKEKIKSFVAGIKGSELEAFISYAIIALVILPFLPDRGFTAADLPGLSTILSSFGFAGSRLANVEIINPFSVWKVVALITGVDILGYVLERTIGQRKGWLLTSIAGGFISSTSTTQSLAQQSREVSNPNNLVAAALFANLSSFIQMFLLLATINSVFLVSNIPFLLSLSAATLIAAWYFLKNKPARENNLDQTRQKIKSDKIFALAPALRFAAIFMVIRIVTKVALTFFGNSGFIVSSLIAALTGLDAVTINAAELAGRSIPVQTGVLTLILANMVNLLSKAGYSFLQGSRQFAVKFLVSVVIMVAASFLGLIPLL